MIAWYQINLMFWTIRFFTKLIDELCGLFIFIFSTLCGYIATYKDMTNRTFGSSVIGAPDKPCGVGRADANPKLLLNDT